MIPDPPPPVNTRPRKSRRRPFGSIKTRPGKPGVYAAFTWRGRTYRRHAGPNRANAEKKLAAAHVMLTGGVPIERVLSEVFGDVTGARLSFRDAAPLYLEYAHGRKKPTTFRADVGRLRIALKASWAGKRLADVTTADLVRWVEDRRRGGASGPTCNRDVAIVSALYRWAIRLEYVDTNPARHVERDKENPGREVYLSATEARALVDSASPLLRPILVAALSTGCRRGELLGLRWHDVDLDRRELRVRPETEKTGHGRTIRLTDALFRELTTLRSRRAAPALDGSDSVFVLADGSPMTVSALRIMFDSTVARCQGIPLAKRDAITFHTLRHTAASLAVQAGVQLQDLAKLLGHSSMTMTMRYAHFAPEAGKSTVDRLGAALALDGPDLGLKNPSESR